MNTAPLTRTQQIAADHALYVTCLSDDFSIRYLARDGLALVPCLCRAHLADLPASLIRAAKGITPGMYFKSCDACPPVNTLLARMPVKP